MMDIHPRLHENLILFSGRNNAGEMTPILQWAYFRIETACWQTRRPTHMCSEPVDGWHVATRGGDSGGI